MDVKANDIEAIVRQVLSNLKDGNSAPSGAAPAASKPQGGVPSKARVAMLTKLEHFDLNEHIVVAELGDGVLFDFKFFELCEHRNLSGLGDRTCGSVCLHVRRALHVCEHLLDDQLNISSIHIHNKYHPFSKISLP